MSETKKQLGIKIDASVGSQQDNQTANDQPTSSDKLIGWIVLLIIVALLGWCTTGPKGPDSNSVEWFLERPKEMERWVDGCSDVQTSSGPLRSADGIQFPQTCENANKAWEASGKKVPLP